MVSRSLGFLVSRPLGFLVSRSLGYMLVISIDREIGGVGQFAGQGDSLSLVDQAVDCIAGQLVGSRLVVCKLVSRSR